MGIGYTVDECTVCDFWALCDFVRSSSRSWLNISRLAVELLKWIHTVLTWPTTSISHTYTAEAFRIIEMMLVTTHSHIFTQTWRYRGIVANCWLWCSFNKVTQNWEQATDRQKQDEFFRGFRAIWSLSRKARRKSRNGANMRQCSAKRVVSSCRLLHSSSSS